MIRDAVIHDHLGERPVGLDDFPLEIGGDGAAVRCPGATPGQVLAYVGIAEGHAFVQPADGVGNPQAATTMTYYDADDAPSGLQPDAWNGLLATVTDAVDPSTTTSVICATS